jgi:hypothetical protein
MISPASRLTTKFLLVSLIAVLLSATSSAQVTSRGPDVGVTDPSIPAHAKHIVLKGEPVCLRRLPDASGSIRLDCAIGLRGDDDQFYGLRAADPTRATGFPEMNARVRVTGQLIRNSGGEYVEAGQIVYASIERIADAKPVTGTLMCVFPRATGAPPVDGCRNAIKTDRGLHWGLDMRTFDASATASRGLAPGDRISLEGDIVHDLPEDWRPWLIPYGAERLEGVLKVRTLKRVTPR